MACLNPRLGVYSEGQAIKGLPERNEESYPQANTASTELSCSEKFHTVHLTPGCAPWQRLSLTWPGRVIRVSREPYHLREDVLKLSLTHINVFQHSAIEGNRRHIAIFELVLGLHQRSTARGAPCDLGHRARLAASPVVYRSHSWAGVVADSTSV
jgi:hypothetical protein